jgi:hypothetical protein
MRTAGTVSTLTRVGVAVLGIVVVLLATIALWARSRAAEDEAFVRERPLLKRMRQQQVENTNASAGAREVLLDVIPLGTGRDAALARLRQERFDCKTTDNAGNSDLRRRFMDRRGLSGIPPSEPPGIACQIGTPQIVGYQQWIVELQFDATDQLTDAVVRKWTIFL